MWLLLGISRHALKQNSAAIAALENAARLSPTDSLPLNALATVLVEVGRIAQALDVMERAIALPPADARTLQNYGVVLDRMGKVQAALVAYERALEIKADFAPARMNRGVALMALGRFDDAVDNNLGLVALQPTSADAHFNLSQSLLGNGQSGEALAASERAIALDGRHAMAHVDRGLALADLGRFDDAQSAFDVADAICPGAVRAYLERIAPADPSLGRSIDPRLFFLYRAYDRLMRCDWSVRDAHIRELEKFSEAADEATKSRIDLPLAYQSLAVPVAPDVPFRIACIIGDRYAAAAGQAGARFHHGRDRGRIRIGYLSADFREHLNAYLSYPLFRLHDRARFEAVAYSIGPDDGSGIRGKIKQSADRFVDLRDMTDLQAACQINSDGIDVLVDFGGYTEHCRPGIGAFRPAPVQIAHIGFPASMGAPWIDYRITDRIATPAAQRRFWREKLVYMPHSFFLYDGEQDVPSEAVSRADYGLPDDAFVFCSHNNSYKMDPEIFSAWMRILKEAPGAVLWLVARDPRIEPNLLAEAGSRGIGRERIRFANPESKHRYFSRYRLADLFLDTPQFNAATTACDALWMGLPLLSLQRGHFTSRQAASILSALGMADMVVNTLDDYRVLALRLAANPADMKSLRDRVARARTAAPMFDTRNYVHCYESAIDAMMARWRQGKAAADLWLSSDGDARTG